jgi:hypothetical protein
MGVSFEKPMDAAANPKGSPTLYGRSWAGPFLRPSVEFV